jgi:hypothetical protein
MPMSDRNLPAPEHPTSFGRCLSVRATVLLKSHSKLLPPYVVLDPVLLKTGNRLHQFAFLQVFNNWNLGLVCRSLAILHFPIVWV